MTSPKIRTEPSDNRSYSGRQRLFTENPVGLRILDALGDRGVAWLANECGQPENTIRDAIKRGIAKTDLALAIASALSCSVDWLLSGYSGDAPDESQWLDLVQVNEIDLTYGMGAAYTDDPIETRVLHFPRVWLETITHSPPADLTFARGRGDSMQPTIQDGDIVLIDRSVKTVREQDAIWALTIGEFAMIKRLRLRGENVTILSDNDRVPEDHAHHTEINIVGRVIFIGRRL